MPFFYSISSRILDITRHKFVCGRRLVKLQIDQMQGTSRSKRTGYVAWSALVWFDWPCAKRLWRIASGLVFRGIGL
jgi:hypothetical protein